MKVIQKFVKWMRKTDDVKPLNRAERRQANRRAGLRPSGDSK